MGDRSDTLVFIDEIQAYDHLLTLLKFLRADDRFMYIASGSQLGVALKRTSSIPIGSISITHMFPMDFEEFLMACGVGSIAIEAMRETFRDMKPLSESLHERMMDFFRKYILTGGLPAVVESYVNKQNIVEVRALQREIHLLYGADASKYETESGKKLKIRRVYDMIPSTLENKKKRIVAKDVENKSWKRMDDYQDEFDFLIASGITLDVKAISNPRYPLVESAGKNLLKLYVNDVGILSGIYYKNSISSVMSDERSVNLGSVYETVVAQELKAHGFDLYYYDNKKNGEVDFLIDDADKLTVIPLEIKSGKDYTVHSALDKFLRNEDYNVKRAYVLSNERNVYDKRGVIYMPIYYVMFFAC